MDEKVIELLKIKIQKAESIVHDLELHGTWVKDKPRYRELKKFIVWAKREVELKSK